MVGIEKYFIDLLLWQEYLRKPGALYDCEKGGNALRLCFSELQYPSEATRICLE